VPRSGADARRRLQQAALDLYREYGFDQTTAADIAERAGVNARTFFRHFPDKREVLFDGEADLRDTMTQAVAETSGGPAALAAQTGWATFHHAAQAWIDDPAQSLDVHLSQAFDDLRALSSPGAER
jgi:AcrR family transcriptional regulator